MRKMETLLFLCALMIPMMLPAMGRADDSQVSRNTLAGLYGVGIVVEDLQPNVRRYAAKAGLTREAVQREAEQRLHACGVPVFQGQEWLKLPGRPFVYININTHETEKYWYAYNVTIELRQLVSMAANPTVQTLATTWSLNTTGTANIGNLPVIRQDVRRLVDHFAAVFRQINRN